MSEKRDTPWDSASALELCQRELAQVRASQEPVLEELAEVRHQLESTRERFQALSREVDEQLQGLPSGTDLLTRGRRWTIRRLRARRREWREAAQLRASTLFNGPWYVRRYPHVVKTGLSPALHYLRHGAQEGLNPGPRFNTRQYLVDHPDAAPASGRNPLLHHLQNGGPSAPGRNT